MCQSQVEPRYQWDKLSARPDKHQRFRRPASEARRSRTKGHELAGQFMKQKQNMAWCGLALTVLKSARNALLDSTTDLR